MKSAQFKLAAGKFLQNCHQVCQNQDATCVDSLQSIFDTCNYHESFNHCESCIDDEYAGFLTGNDNGKTVCTAWSATISNTPNCDTHKRKEFKPLCACVMQ